MARELRSAEEIWFEIESHLLQCFDGYADPTVYIPLPRLASLPDDTGCNWRIGPLRTDSSNQARIEAAVAMARNKFNLAARPASAGISATLAATLGRP